MAACWTSEVGGLNKFVHTWVYKDLNERTRVREASAVRWRVAAPDRGAAAPAGKQAARAGGLLPVR